VQKLQHPVVFVQAIIENGIRPDAGSVDHVLLGVLVQFIREN
jgi:hypothetical protein